jgi:hypothetical protein
MSKRTQEILAGMTLEQKIYRVGRVLCEYNSAFVATEHS